MENWMAEWHFISFVLYPILFCNWILLIWNGFWSQSIISFLSPLILGSKLTKKTNEKPNGTQDPIYFLGILPSSVPSYQLSCAIAIASSSGSLHIMHMQTNNLHRTDNCSDPDKELKLLTFCRFTNKAVLPFEIVDHPHIVSKQGGC